jgi:thioredoxin reductase
MGNAWTGLDIPGVKPLVGKTVHYGPVMSLGYVERGSVVAVLGGGPSAGQAIVELAEKGVHVHVICCGPR